MSSEPKDFCEICLQKGIETAATTSRILSHHPDPEIEDCPCGGRLVNLCEACSELEERAQEEALEGDAATL
ncbi:MAG: hypothetical protein RLO23_01525 [Alphaproteobacteria bacterium]